MSHTTLQAVFFAGFVAQSLFLLGPAAVKKWKSLLMCLALAAFVTLDDRGSNLFQACLGYSLAFVIYFAKEGLRTIGPEILILWSLLLFYIGYRHDSVWLLTLALATLITNLLSYVTDTADRSSLNKLYYYISYLALICLVSYFGFDLVKPAVREVLYGTGGTYSPLVSFMAGSALTTVAISAAYLYMLIPNRGNDTDDIKKLAKHMYTSYDPNPQAGVLVPVFLIFAALALFVNAVFPQVTDGFLISALISAGYLVTTQMKPPASVTVKPKPSAAASQKV